MNRLRTAQSSQSAHRDTFTWGYIAMSLPLLLFILITISYMIYMQVTEDFSGLIETATDSAVLRSILLSMYAGFLATLISLISGVPLAYILARYSFRGKGIIESVIDIPVVVPHTVAGIALLTVFGAHGLIGDPLSEVVRFRDALPGIVVAMVFVSAPFLTNYAREGFSAVNPKLENVARSLGASRWTAFRKITLPLAAPHILTGSIMCWARAISEFGAVVIIAYYPMIAPTLIYDRFISQGLSASRPVAVLLILIILLVFVAVRAYSAHMRYDDRT